MNPAFSSWMVAIMLAASCSALPTPGGIGGPVGSGPVGWGPGVPSTVGYNGGFTGYTGGNYGYGGGIGYAAPGWFNGFTAFNAQFFANKLAEHERVLKELNLLESHHERKDVKKVNLKEAKEHDLIKANVADVRASVGNTGFF